MEKKEIIETLREFGMSEYEARTYLTLIFIGPSKAGDISRESNVPQSKIYDVLDILMRRQLVEVFEGRPKEFKALSPKAAFKGLIEDRENGLKSLKQKISDLNGLLKPVVKGKIIEGIWTQKNRKSKEVLNRLSEMLERCRNYAYDITRDFSYSSRYREATKSCIRRGVRLKVIGIGPINKNNYYKIKWYSVNNIPIRVFETKVHPRILVVDGKEVSIRLDHNPLKNKFSFHSIWSEDPSLVKVFDIYMKNLWKIARPLSTREIPKPA